MQRAPTVSLTSDKTDRPKTDHLSYNEDIQGFKDMLQIGKCPWGIVMKIRASLEASQPQWRYKYNFHVASGSVRCKLLKCACCLSTFHVVTPYVWLFAIPICLSYSRPSQVHRIWIELLPESDVETEYCKHFFGYSLYFRMTFPPFRFGPTVIPIQTCPGAVDRLVSK